MNTNNYLLVIPSRERAIWLMNKTHHTLKATAHLKPILYVRQDDTQLDIYKKMAELYNVELLLQDPSALGAAQTYDSLINMAIKQGYERLVILDDDLSFSMHNPIIGAKPDFTKCTPYQLEVLVNHFANLTSNELPAMSMTPIMKRSQETIVSYCHPLMWTYSFYLPHFAAYPEHRFWQGKHIEARCDLNLALKLLTSGFLTAFMVTCFIPDNVNNPGGCSTYRTLELEQQSVEYLVKTYPNLVHTHKMKGWVGDDEVLRDAPIIKWKKALNYNAFKKHFNKSPFDFTTKHLSAYEKVYADFIKELRK